MAGVPCSWTWLPAKLGYGKYDEGMAFFCLNGNIEETDAFYISKIQDYGCWKTRMALGIKISGCEDWFYTTHMGWWYDDEEPFLEQWKALEARLKPKKDRGNVWLMGDFNSPAGIRGQGYDCIRESGWQDTWLMAEQKKGSITVEGMIDGWREYQEKQRGLAAGMRIGHIWCSRKVPVLVSRVLFNGESVPKVSDHFGVMIQTGGERMDLEE